MEDGIALAGAIDAEVIPMAGVEDGVAGLDSCNLADDVRGVVVADVAYDFSLELNGEIEGFEGALVGLVDGLIGGEPDGAEELVGDGVLDPGGGGEAGIGVAAQVAVLAGPAVLDHGPAVAGEVCAVDDEGGDGTVAAGFFKLIGPAAVVGEGFAFEEICIGGGWFVDDDDDGLALDVDAGVVVPVVFRRDDAVADEDEGDVEGGFVGVSLVVDDEVGAEGKVSGRGGFGAGAWNEVEVCLRGDGLDADERHRLQKRTVVASGLEAVGAEGVCDEIGGEDATGLAGASAFELVARELLYGGAEALWVDRGGFGLGTGGERCELLGVEGGREQGCGEG